MIHQASNIIITSQRNPNFLIKSKEELSRKWEQQQTQASSDKRSWRSLTRHDSLVEETWERLVKRREKDAWERREEGEKNSSQPLGERKNKSYEIFSWPKSIKYPFLCEITNMPLPQACYIRLWYLLCNTLMLHNKYPPLTFFQNTFFGTIDWYSSDTDRRDVTFLPPLKKFRPRNLETNYQSSQLRFAFSNVYEVWLYSLHRVRSILSSSKYVTQPLSLFA
jgi:hypothetical protein